MTVGVERAASRVEDAGIRDGEIAARLQGPSVEGQGPDPEGRRIDRARAAVRIDADAELAARKNGAPRIGVAAGQNHGAAETGDIRDGQGAWAVAVADRAGIGERMPAGIERAAGHVEETGVGDREIAAGLQCAAVEGQRADPEGRRLDRAGAAHRIDADPYRSARKRRSTRVGVRPRQSQGARPQFQEAPRSPEMGVAMLVVAVPSTRIVASPRATSALPACGTIE